MASPAGNDFMTTLKVNRVMKDILDVRTTNQSGSTGNTNLTSRIPGYGQPCNLAPAQLGTAALTLQRCQSQTP